MKKWGVRLISISFLLGAITNYFDVIWMHTPLHGFLGMSLYAVSGPSSETLSMEPQLDIMALIGLCINLYVAYNLSLFRNQGRRWALFILVLSTLISIVNVSILYFNYHVSPFTTMLVTLAYLNYSFKTSLAAIVGSTIFFYAIQIYFLVRKDVKSEFQKPIDVEVNHKKSEEQTVQ